ncbi:MAG: hypothetical protein KAQ67_06035, partial [Gammaproteobacteria bacterium]|nr:hypothetical protein [Gammaproteobacteria bacterium]
MNLSIKVRLIVIGFIMFALVATVMLMEAYSKNQIAGLEKSLNLVHITKSNMLTLRRNEKDFLARNNLKYQKKFQNNIDKMKATLQVLSLKLQAQGIDGSQVEALEQNTDQYAVVFEKLVNEQKRIGLNPKDGLYGSLRNAVHAAESTIKELKDDKLFKDMLMLRRREKDFMLRVDLKYLGKFNKDMQVIYQDVNNSSYNKTTKAQLHNSLKQYEKDFLQLVEAYKVKGLSSKEGLHGELRKAIHQTEGLLKELSNELPVLIDQTKSNLNNQVLLISLIVLSIGLLFIFFTIRSIIQSLAHLSETFKKVFANM